MSTSGEVALSQLGDIVSEANAIRDPAALEPYRVDAKVPAAAVRPGSADEVAEIVKLAARERLAVITSGARTKLGIGAPPQRYDIALDMGRMDRIVAYDPGDLTLSIEAGIPLKKISSALAGHRQFLPLAVPFMDRATAGGTIASGVDSPLRHSYGTARDFMLGVEFITGDGVAAKSGGRVVKNVAGYDIHKLMIGSQGTLGVITRLHFRTFPLPRATRTFVAVFGRPGGACEFRNAVAKAALRPQSFEILGSGGEGARNLADLTGLPCEGNRWFAVVSCAGNEEVLARCEEELESSATGAGGAIHEASGDARDKITTLVSEFPAALLNRAPNAAILKVSALPSELADLVRAIQLISLPWALVMRGLGVGYLALVPENAGDAGLDLLQQECKRILGLAGKAPWRHVTLPWCPAALKGEINVWGASTPNSTLMKKLKQVFDPAGILSPGRFVGGI